MPRGLRWDDPPCGREGFDGRAGWEWENGPSPNETTYSVPDVPWNKLKAVEVINPRCLWDNGQWAVTTFGLQPLYSDEPEQYEPYEIAVSDLLRMRPGGGVYFWPVHVAPRAWFDFVAFEETFKKALEIHSRKVDDEILDRTFRRARAIARKSRKAA